MRYFTGFHDNENDDDGDDDGGSGAVVTQSPYRSSRVYIRPFRHEREIELGVSGSPFRRIPFRIMSAIDCSDLKRVRLRANGRSTNGRLIEVTS